MRHIENPFKPKPQVGNSRDGAGDFIDGLAGVIEVSARAVMRPFFRTGVGLADELQFRRNPCSPSAYDKFLGKIETHRGRAESGGIIASESKMVGGAAVGLVGTAVAYAGHTTESRIIAGITATAGIALTIRGAMEVYSRRFGHAHAEKNKGREDRHRSTWIKEMGPQGQGGILHQNHVYHSDRANDLISRDPRTPIGEILNPILALYHQGRANTIGRKIGRRMIPYADQIK